MTGDLCKTRDYADSNVEIDRQVLSALWIDEDNLAFSVKQKGIYVYNAKTYQKKGNRMDSEYEVIFYDLPDGSEPVVDFINSQPQKMAAKIHWTIDREGKALQG